MLRTTDAEARAPFGLSAQGLTTPEAGYVTGSM